MDIKVTDNKPIVAQKTNCDNNQEMDGAKPVAAPSTLDGEIPSITMCSFVNIDLMSRSVEELPEVQLRSPETAAKLEMPARPTSLSKRTSVDSHLDLNVYRTKSSVYSVDHKQQLSFVNVQNRNEKFQPEHDNLIAKKERFLRHLPRTSLENKLGDITSKSKLGLLPKVVKVENSDASKSNEDLGDLGEEMNRNQKHSHVRTRSDGYGIELKESCLLRTTPIQPPPPWPPPPVIHKKEPDKYLIQDIEREQ